MCPVILPSFFSPPDPAQPPLAPRQLTPVPVGRSAGRRAHHHLGRRGMGKVWPCPTLTPRLAAGPGYQMCCLFARISWTSSKSKATERPELQVGARPASAALELLLALTRQLWRSWADAQTPHLVLFGSRTTRRGSLNCTISHGDPTMHNGSKVGKTKANLSPTIWWANREKEPSLCKMLLSSALFFHVFIFG